MINNIARRLHTSSLFNFRAPMVARPTGVSPIIKTGCRRHLIHHRLINSQSKALQAFIHNKAEENIGILL